MRQLVQYLRQVAAGFLLDQKRSNKKTYIHQGYALREIQQRVLERHPEVLLLEGGAEFPRQGLRQLLGDHLEAGSKSVTGAHRATQQVDRLGKALFKCSQAPGTREQQRGERNKSCPTAND